MMITDEKLILIVIPDLNDMGGVANYYKSIMPHLNVKGHKVAHLEIGSTKGKGNLMYPFFDQLNFSRLIRRRHPDLIHINPSLDFKSFIRDGLFILQAKRHKIPVLVFFRGWSKEFERIIEKYFLKVFQHVYGKADAFIVLGSEFKKKLVSWNISAPIHIETTTFNNVLLEKFDIATRIENLLENKQLRILFLSRLEKAKGLFETIDALALLIMKKIPVTLTIAGDGSIKKEVESYVKSRKLPKDAVKFLGYVSGESKISAFLSNDLYCFPTYGEGLPNALLEALAFGMPVITCPVGGITDIFKNGIMGVFVPVRDVKAIADQIEIMNQDRQGLVRMAQYNHSFAIKTFSAPQVALRLSEIYQHVT